MMENEHPFSVGTLHSTLCDDGLWRKVASPDADAEETCYQRLAVEGIELKVTSIDLNSELGNCLAQKS